MSEPKSKSTEQREKATSDEQDGLSVFYYPELGRSVRAENREAADKIIKDTKEVSKEATGEDEAK